MAFTDVLRKAFPFISMAAGLGGPLGTIACSVVGKALNVDKEKTPTIESLPDLLASAFANPEQRAALIKAEQDFQAQMAELGYHDAETLAAAANEDRASARQREMTLKDWMPAGLSTVCVVGFFGIVGLFAYCGFKGLDLSAGVKPVLYMLLGTLAREVASVYAYYFGTSASSDNKTEIIADIAKS